MTREEFFYKYGCECKDPNCSSVVKEKCSAEFFRDLDSVFESYLKAGDLVRKEAAIQAICDAEIKFKTKEELKTIGPYISDLLDAQIEAIRNIGKESENDN